MGRMSLRGGRMNVDLRKNQGDLAALEYNVDELSSDTDIRFMSVRSQCLLTDSIIFFPCSLEPSHFLSLASSTV